MSKVLRLCVLIILLSGCFKADNSECQGNLSWKNSSRFKGGKRVIEARVSGLQYPIRLQYYEEYGAIWLPYDEMNSYRDGLVDENISEFMYDVKLNNLEGEDTLRIYVALTDNPEKFDSIKLVGLNYRNEIDYIMTLYPNGTGMLNSPINGNLPN